MSVEKSMMLITSIWGQSKTFKLISLTNDGPYLECIYDPMSKALILLTRLQKEGFHMVSKLDDNGDQIRSLKAQAGQDPHKKERKALTTSHEVYITEKEEIITFINMFAYNSDYDYKQYLVDPAIIKPEVKKLIMP